ncbi:hypothetical protein ACJX0J_008769 [Zea mays]
MFSTCDMKSDSLRYSFYTGDYIKEWALLTANLHAETIGTLMMMIRRTRTHEQTKGNTILHAELLSVFNPFLQSTKFGQETGGTSEYMTDETHVKTQKKCSTKTDGTHDALQHLHQSFSRRIVKCCLKS